MLTEATAVETRRTQRGLDKHYCTEVALLENLSPSLKVNKQKNAVSFIPFLLQAA